MKWLTVAYVFGGVFALAVGMSVETPVNVILTPVAYVLGTYACAYIILVILDSLGVAASE